MRWFFLQQNLFSSGPQKTVYQPYVPLLMIGILSTGIVAVWLRNHDILRDLFDYSIVISAAGKIEAGFKPFVDVRSPMQSSVYLLNYATEQLFGRNYLALTWGGLMQALGGAWLLFGLLYRSWGNLKAMLLASAVAMAGLLQHVVFFYNPIGILCFSVVLLGLAINPDLWPVRSWRTAAIYCALLVGGINKLNFQGATLGLAGVLTLSAVAQGRLSRWGAGRNVLLLLLGCGLPLALELAWTGATLQQWVGDVVLLPAARHHLIGEIFRAGIYLRPVYAYHHHVLVGAIGGIGLVLLLATGTWLQWNAGGGRLGWGDRLMRASLIIAGWAMGALLMITSHETVMLTSLAYPVFATALFLRYRQPERRADRWMQTGLLAAAGCWSVLGAYAAWHGSRVLYGQNEPPRSAYVRLHSEARALAYVKGVRMLPEQIDALERVAERLRTLEDPSGKLTGILFGPALEWMERAYPESMARGEPVWYDAGTTLHENDAVYFRKLLGEGTHRLITHKAWQAWPNTIREMLERDYRMEAIGSRDVMYHPLWPAMPAVADAAAAQPTPLEFRDATGSNLLITTTRSSSGLFLQPGASGAAYGANQPSVWFWPQGGRDLRGVAVARLDSGATTSGVVNFRIVADNPDYGEILMERTAYLSPGNREVMMPVRLQPGGRPLWFMITPGEGNSGMLFGGWREMLILHAAAADGTPVLPFRKELQPGPTQAPNERWFVLDPDAGDPAGWNKVPAENWRRGGAGSGIVRARIEFEPNPKDPADPVIVTLAWQGAGRFDIMAERMIDPRTTSTVALEALVPEPGGWIGVLARPAGGEGAGHRMRIQSWEHQ